MGILILLGSIILALIVSYPMTWVMLRLFAFIDRRVRRPDDVQKVSSADDRIEGAHLPREP